MVSFKFKYCGFHSSHNEKSKVLRYFLSFRIIFGLILVYGFFIRLVLSSKTFNGGIVLVVYTVCFASRISWVRIPLPPPFVWLHRIAVSTNHFQWLKVGPTPTGAAIILSLSIMRFWFLLRWFKSIRDNHLWFSHTHKKRCTVSSVCSFISFSFYSFQRFKMKDWFIADSRRGQSHLAHNQTEEIPRWVRFPHPLPV